MESPATSLSQRLKRIEVFASLPEEDLLWLASHMSVVDYQPGDVIVKEGEPADRLIVVLEGEMQGLRGDGRSYSARKGQVTGMLPYSRLKNFPITVRAMTPGTVAFLGVEHFPEMLERMPELGPKLVSVLADRVRDVTRAEQQREKLTALGKLSAGLAHELNNPASAVRNAALSLQQAVRDLRTAGLRLDKRALAAEDRIFLAHIECDWSKDHPPAALDSLDRSDREEEIGAWLEAQGIEAARRLAPDLVDAACDIAALQRLDERFGTEMLADVITRLSVSFRINRLVEQIESGTSRMADLVRAIKQYSYRDESPEQEIDVHDGLENTLIMLHYRLKHGITVVREYDRSIPRICARGSELNQVWTNIIDNAIDAMHGSGELLVRTAAEFGRVLVEIRDSGPGIPPEIRDRIFEPFFTTKPVGEGTGLGLDTVYRIVQNHRGEVRVDSRPGKTSFQIRLPFARATQAAGG